MSGDNQKTTKPREAEPQKRVRESIEKASRDPDSIRGSGGPASGNPGVGKDTGKYED